MLLAEQFRETLATIGSFIAPRRPWRFNCGDCERNAQCGSLPHDDCEYRFIQLARDGDSPPRRSEYFHEAIWPR
jgi:hypothetical protein